MRWSAWVESFFLLSQKISSAKQTLRAGVLAAVVLLAVGAAAQTEVAKSLGNLPIATQPRPAAALSDPEIAEPPAHQAHVPRKYDINKIGDRGIGGGLNLYSLERERQWGQSLAADVESQARLIKDPVIDEYINRLAQNLVRHSDAKVPFTVKVIDDDEINAFALPGGYFYVYSGLIMAADNEAELAGVMAHEIGHVAARHASKSATRSQLINLASIPLIMFGGAAGYTVRQVMGLALPMSYLKFSRDAEREADLLGLEYAYAAGYDPNELVRFLETIKSRHKSKLSFIGKAFATHPMTQDRIRRAQKEIEEFLPAKPEYIIDSSEFEMVKARLNAVRLRHRIDSGGKEQPVLRRRGPKD